ncbi:putative cytochrome P450 135A1 [Streptomyces daghestanicus]|nr:putative cytochrome P450 135A1 [Streptomyces daghestanicus]
MLFLWHRPWLNRRLRGDTVPLRTRNRNGPGLSSRGTLIVNGPDHVKQVFAGSPDTWHAGECYEIITPLVSELSMLVQDRQEHARSRKLVTPAFTSAALRSYEPMIGTLAEDEVRQWPTGRTFRVQDRMQRVTLEIILRVVFGVTDPARLTRLHALVPALTDVSPVVLMGLHRRSLRPLPPWRTWLASRREFVAVLRAQIAEHRQAGPGARSDVLSRLLKAEVDGDRLSDDELVGQLMTLVMAGYETTATAMTWLVHDLARMPDVQDRARRAASEGDTAYLDAVVKECMRIHPVLALVSRGLSEEAEIGGVRVAAGESVAASVSLAHFNPAHFPEPDRFRPERFLGDAPPPATAWFPFGGGVRRCIGAAFSLLESRLLLRWILLTFELTAPTTGPERAKARTVVTAPHRGGRVIATPRTS